MKHLRLMAIGETLFIRAAIAFLSLLVVVQFFFLKDTTRSYLSYIDRLEGESVSIQMPLYSIKPLYIRETSQAAANPIKTLRESKVIIVRMVTPRSSQAVFLTVNGQTAGDFGSGDLKVTVFNGDYLEIDASAFSETAQFVTHIPNAGVAYPEDGMLIEAKGATVTIGKVKFK